ncbi:MAG: pyridoxal phosphate-dependent aminotransferase [Anaerolineae bacterium]|nr:pyridoxal phosphate-dependent aminotransferase [Anaerolineae bacterium]
MGFLQNADLSLNLIEQARRASAGYIDLTSSNPTHQGLLFPAQVLREASEGYWATRRYAPDARGDARAREAIQRYYDLRVASCVGSQATNARRNTHDVFITASTSEAYSLLFALLTEPGDNVLAPDVGYPLFDFLAEMHHTTLKPYRLDEARRWQIDESSLVKSADERTRAVLVISPHNPTGNIVQSPIPNIQSLNLPIICDEVFAEFTVGVAHTPVMSALHLGLPVFVLNGLSKMFALPDLKLGWIAMNEQASEYYAERLEVLNDTFLSANYLTQFMLPTLFERGWDFVTQQREHVRRNMNLALEMLAQCSAIKTRLPDGGYNLFCEVLGWDNAPGSEDALVLHLLQQGVLVHPGYFFNCTQGAHILISCLTETTQLQAGLERLIAALA